MVAILDSNYGFWALGRFFSVAILDSKLILWQYSTAMWQYSTAMWQYSTAKIAVLPNKLI